MPGVQKPSKFITQTRQQIAGGIKSKNYYNSQGVSSPKSAQNKYIDIQKANMAAKQNYIQSVLNK